MYYSLYKIAVLPSASDPSLNLADQKGQQQAVLISRFRQLREWQQRQQELLMTQQQSQLDLLREEQERVQRMISKQRGELQWGAATLPPRNGMKSEPWSSQTNVLAVWSTSGAAL